MSRKVISRRTIFSIGHPDVTAAGLAPRAVHAVWFIMEMERAEEFNCPEMRAARIGHTRFGTPTVTRLAGYGGLKFRIYAAAADSPPLRHSRSLVLGEG